MVDNFCHGKFVGRMTVNQEATKVSILSCFRDGGLMRRKLENTKF
jgi:hypothetical protein